jgi:hypothetical protein
MKNFMFGVLVSTVMLLIVSSIVKVQKDHYSKILKVTKTK